MHILVVDDQPDFCSAASKLLNLLGHSCSTALTGQDALRKMRSEHPAIVLLDLRLGDESIAGKDVIQRKLLDPEIRGIDVVVVTGLLDAGDEDADRFEVVRNALAGRTIVLGKPVSMDVLRTVFSLLDDEHDLAHAIGAPH